MGGQGQKVGCPGDGGEEQEDEEGAQRNWATRGGIRERWAPRRGKGWVGTAEVLRESRAPLHTCVEGLDFPEPCPVQRTTVTPRSCPQETKEASAQSPYPLSQAEPALDLPPFCLLSCWYWSPPLDSRQRLQVQRGGERPPCLATPC